MRRTHILLMIGLMLILSACNPAKAENAAEQRRADAEALLAKVRNVLPKGWEAQLYWNPNAPNFKPIRLSPDWPTEKWRDWLPGMDSRRIEVRRKELVHYSEDAPGPDPHAHYIQKVATRPRFALTLGERRKAEEVKQRLAELNSGIERLEVQLKSSFYRRNKDGYVQHTVPPDDEGRNAAREYDRLWTIKRWFPQWTKGSVSVGFRSLIWLMPLPEESKREYRKVKQSVLGVLKPVEDWNLIPAADE